MNKLTISWALAALSYDEDNFVNYVFELFGLRAHVMHDKNMSFFSGIVPDDRNNTLYIFNRGTDGANWMGNIQSWARNFRILTGTDGVHNGFQGIGNKVIDKFKSYIYRYDTVVISGQSQGAGVVPYQACLVAENFTHVDHVYGFSFAAPPTGNKVFAERVQKHVDNKVLTLNRYNNNGDYITSGFFRNQDSMIFDGVDVGKEHVLPVIVGYNKTPSLRLVQHSNRITNAALMQLYAVERDRAEEIYVLSDIGKRIIN